MCLSRTWGVTICIHVVRGGLTEFTASATLPPYTATWSPAPIRNPSQPPRFGALSAPSDKDLSLGNLRFHRNSQIITPQSHPLHRCNHQINSQNLPLRQGHGRPSERCSGDHAKS